MQAAFSKPQNGSKAACTFQSKPKPRTKPSNSDVRVCAESTHAVSSFQTASIRSLRPSEILVLSPATQRRKPILPIRPRKPTRPRRNQKARRQHRNLDIRLRPVRQTPLQRTPRQTRLDEYRTETHPLRLGRNAITSGVHLQRQLHLSLHRPRQLRTPSPSLP